MRFVHPETLHTLQKSDMFIRWLEKATWLDASGLSSSSSSKPERTATKTKWCLAPANQTRAVESLNGTTSKIRAGVRLAPHHCTNILNTAQLSLTKCEPVTANHRKQRLHSDLICLWLFGLELAHVMNQTCAVRDGMWQPRNRGPNMSACILLLVKGEKCSWILWIRSKT